jgi:AcrR family transcriptional regulator
MTEATEVLSSRRQHKEERREQILDAALRIFAQKGFVGASIRDIAKEVGVTEGLLYHYFESKEQLLNACWKERTWRAHLERILAEGAEKPLQSVLSELVLDFMKTLRENAEMVRFCASERQRNPELAEFHLRKIEENHHLLCSFLRHRQEAGEIRSGADVSTAAGLLMGTAYSCFLLYGEHDDSVWLPIVDGLSTSGVDVLMNGIRHAPAV